MDIKFRDEFISKWHKYFNNAELPITFSYTDETGHADLARPGMLPRCIIGALAKIRRGSSYSFDANSVGCFGGRRYLGFVQKMRPDFEYFLSCGIPGKMEGERYKKSPELVREAMKIAPDFKAPARFAVFKRWDRLERSDKPEVVIFFVQPDVLSGLFTLASYDEAEPNGVFAPFGSGCSSIIQYPYLEKDSKRSRAVIGMFDVSARPYVLGGRLTFAVPINKFERMVKNMDESFLTTDSWKKVQRRIK